MVVCVYNSNYTGGIVRRIAVQNWPGGKSRRPCLKITYSKKGPGGVAQVSDKVFA
jgi:hypothetical protein